MSLDKKDIESRVVDVLKTIFDPEIPVDIYELGLIYFNDAYISFLPCS
jgi:metal-sulfur cluster biosynthetic enzyme